MLAAIIMVAVFGLIDIKTFRHVWKYNKADAASMIVTFLAVLAIGVESGILIGCCRRAAVVCMAGKPAPYGRGGPHSQNRKPTATWNDTR